MQPADYNYKNISPLDVLCTAAHSPESSFIRLATARLKGFRGAKQFRFKKCTIANHCAIVIKMKNLYWLAEMCPDGLRINSMRKYLNNKREKIVAIRRHKELTLSPHSQKGNDILVHMANNMVGYDYSMIKEYLGIGHDKPSKFYCSELAEHIANRCGFTWDQWNLRREHEGKTLIAPVEVQHGSDIMCVDVQNYYIY